MAYKERHHKQLQMPNWIAQLRQAHQDDPNGHIN
jgi:hypothetical protein